MIRFSICAVTILIFTLSLKVWAENSASGTLTVNGSATEIKFAYVNEGPEDLILVVSDRPLEKNDVPFGLHVLAMEDKARGMAFTISKSTRALSSGLNAMYHPVWSGQLGTLGNGELTISKFDDTEISGKLSTADENTFSDYKFSYDISFSVKLGEPVKTEPLNVEIQVTEDAPSKAYAEYYKAIMSGNKDEIRKHLASEILQQADEETLNTLIEFSQMFRPVNLKISGSKIDGSDAVVSAEGERDGEKSTGSITMKLEDGAWKIVKDSWKGGM